MKIKYEFANETIEIEVDEEWGAVLIDLDRQEYNNDKKETRRSCSLDAFNAGGNLFADGTDMEGSFIAFEDSKKLYEAIKKLGPWQRFLIEQHYFAGKKQTEIVEETGIGKAAISRAIKRAKENLKNLLEEM